MPTVGTSEEGPYVQYDGSINVGGSRSWRDNNPGNIVAGAFANVHGAIGSEPPGDLATLAARMASGIEQANGLVAFEPLMEVQNVASAVVYMASLPLDANVQFMTIMATKMPFVGRG